MAGLECSEGRTPAMQYREDLGMVVKELEIQGVCVILGGDFNFAWHKEYETASYGGVYAAEWQKWVRYTRGMTNAAGEALQEPVPTFARNETTDDKAMMLLRHEAAAMALADVGVLDHESPADAPARSEH